MRQYHKGVSLWAINSWCVKCCGNKVPAAVVQGQWCYVLSCLCSQLDLQHRMFLLPAGPQMPLCLPGEMMAKQKTVLIVNLHSVTEETDSSLWKPLECSCVWSFGRQWFCVDHMDDMVCLMVFLRTKILHVLIWKVWTGIMFQPEPFPHESESSDPCSFYAASCLIHFWFCWNYFVGL